MVGLCSASSAERATVADDMPDFWKRFESRIRRQFNSCSKCRKSAPEGGTEFADWGILTVPILMIPIGLTSIFHAAGSVRTEPVLAGLWG
jgi:hypothetical protein